MAISEKRTYKFLKFEECILSPTVNIDTLRNLSWNGIPDEYRMLTWQLLLGYLPANSSRRSATLQRKRREYSMFSQSYVQLNSTTMTEHDQETLFQVQKDVPRTLPNIKLFRNNRVQFCLERLLFSWAMRHPASSYVQGMNDLVCPLFAVFLEGHLDGEDVETFDMDSLPDDVLSNVEADSYWCLTEILSKIHDHYTPDQPGIQRMNYRLEELMKRINGDFCSHLQQEGIDMCHFSFEWMNCLFVREFPLQCVIRLWDTYLSEEDRGFDAFHVYVCGAFLSHFSSQAKAMEFEDLFSFLLNLPTEDWDCTQMELLLSQGFMCRIYLGEYLDRLTREESQQVRANSFQRSVKRTAELGPIKVMNQKANVGTVAGGITGIAESIIPSFLINNVKQIWQ